MIIRTKSGDYRAGNADVLLEFLRGRSEEGEGRSGEAGRRVKITEDIELIASVPFCLAAESEAAQGVAFTFSTFDLDRYSERVDPAGWKLDNYLKNPVVQWAHRFDIPAIGKAENVYADEKGLHGTVIFNDKEFDTFGWSIGERVRRGILRAMSVGFRVMEIEIPSKEEAKDGTALIFRQQELLENSVCNVPANPFALAKSAPEQETETKQDICFSSFWGNIINNL